MADYEAVKYFLEDGIATIKLNRPQVMNAFNSILRSDLLAAIKRADADSSVRIVVIAAVGKGFSSGADLAEVNASAQSVEEQLMEEYFPILSAIDKSNKLYISSVNGAAAGIGSALAMACDLTIMGESGYIYQAFAAIGLIPDGGASWHLLHSLGYKRALEIIVEAKKIPAKRCLELGLVNKVVADNDLEKETKLWAGKLAKGAPLAQRYSKQVLKQAHALSLDQTIALEAKYQNITSLSADASEGITAFFQKRAPKFTGK